MPDEPTGDASASSAMDGLRALPFRISGRLNRMTRGYLGPAQVGTGRRATTVQPLSSSPCPGCGHPMLDHDLERTPGAKSRFYCPAG
jgi:hypothetical protein